MCISDIQAIFFDLIPMILIFKVMISHFSGDFVVTHHRCQVAPKKLFCTVITKPGRQKKINCPSTSQHFSRTKQLKCQPNPTPPFPIISIRDKKEYIIGANKLLFCCSRQFICNQQMLEDEVFLIHNFTLQGSTLFVLNHALLGVVSKFQACVQE